MTTPADRHRPAGRTAQERLLLRLEWRVIRRLDGRLAGGYRTANRGTGTDLAGLREYAAGDDARHIDWSATARLNEPQLRLFTEDRELTVWLVLDRSASMSVGPPGRGKHDVLTELALVLARMFGRGGNRVGALLYDIDNKRRRMTTPTTRPRYAPSRWAPGAHTCCASAPSSPGPPAPRAEVPARTAARPTWRRCSTRSPSSPSAAP